ncbi:MAG: hypothetical protein KIS81_04840 [Maricaulaceae bacterium]|nr:hypothetical protein [Maricaulaceae bacterium]
MTAKDDEPEPLDAEFEPAEPDPAPKRGGGWLGGLVLFIAASLAGGALGFFGSQMFGTAQDHPGAAAERAALIETIDAIETRLDAIESADPAADMRERVAALTERVDRLEVSPPVQIVEGAAPDALAQLQARIAALEARPAAAPGEAPDLGPLQSRLDAAEREARDARALADQALDAAQAVQPGADAAQLLALEQRLTALEARETPEALDDSELRAALSALEQRIDAAEAAAREAREAGTARGEGADAARTLAARTLALMALSEAASGTGSFEAERAALARLWRGQPDIEALAAYARAGAPDRDTLAASFPGDAVREAAGPSRVFFGLIELRRSGPGEAADGPRALAALAEARLNAGDLPGAVSAAERLEDDALAAAQAWLLQAQARLEIDRRVAALRAALTAEAAEQGADPR